MAFRKTPDQKRAQRQNLTARRYLTAYVSGGQSTGTAKATFAPLPEGGRYIGCVATLGTPATGATTFKLDVNKNGTTLYTTQGRRPTFAASSGTSVEAAPADVTALAKGDILTVDIDAVGSSTAGSDLKIFITYEI